MDDVIANPLPQERTPWKLHEEDYAASTAVVYCRVFDRSNTTPARENPAYENVDDLKTHFLRCDLTPHPIVNQDVAVFRTSLRPDARTLSTVIEARHGEIPMTATRWHEQYMEWLGQNLPRLEPMLKADYAYEKPDNLDPTGPFHILPAYRVALATFAHDLGYEVLRLTRRLTYVLRPSALAQVRGRPAPGALTDLTAEDVKTEKDHRKYVDDALANGVDVSPQAIDTYPELRDVPAVQSLRKKWIDEALNVDAKNAEKLGRIMHDAAKAINSTRDETVKMEAREKVLKGLRATFGIASKLLYAGSWVGARSLQVLTRTFHLPGPGGEGAPRPPRFPSWPDAYVEMGHYLDNPMETPEGTPVLLVSINEINNLLQDLAKRLEEYRRTGKMDDTSGDPPLDTMANELMKFATNACSSGELQWSPGINEIQRVASIVG